MPMSGKTKKNPFPLPSEITDVPGAEGWESMYPYFTRYRKEDDERFWFYNSMHFPEPMTAFDVITAEVPYQAMGAVTTRVYAFPTALGIDHRIVNGRVYITANPVTDPKRVEERLSYFQARAGHYYEHWNELYKKWEGKMRALLDEINAIRVPSLDEYEPESTVQNARGIAENHFVREAYHRTVESYSKMWHYHFEFLMLGYGAYVVFFEFCKKAFPEIPDQIVARMVAGIEVLMFRPDDELKCLAKVAVDCGIGDCFTEGGDPDKTMAAIKAKGARGQEWLNELDKSREPWFHISTGDGFHHNHRSWNDDLSVPFAALPRYIEMVKKGISLERPTEKLREERQRIIDEYRALLSTEQDKATFDQMLGLCHLVFPYVENHKFYCEHWFTTLFFNKIRDFGALLARMDILEDGEDVFHLHHTEVDLAIGDAMIAWAAGSPSVGAQHWPAIVKKRKEIHEKLKAWNAPPALGPMPEVINDPAVQMLWGITSETLHAWSKPADETNENEVRGFAASPGIVEGVARVLENVNDIGAILEGEILVCPVTNPSWGPVFGKIKAAVSDIGGTMSHAAIVAREYGMPAVVGTGKATKLIKTGQRLRVNGNEGIVTILG